MNDAILIQQAYPGNGYEGMIELTRERNEEYCKRWGFDYQVHIDTVVPEWDYWMGGWAKIELIHRALDAGYKYVVWLDADAMIYDLDTDLRDGCPDGIGLCWHRIPQLHHWNVGVMFMQNTEAVKSFILEWITKYPGARDGWNEQGEFNRMGRKSRVVQTISDRWNATINVNMVPDAVILGFHGHGDAKQRFTAMKDTLDKISVKEAARQAQVQSEVNNG
jgi:hypothetical protein